MIPSCTARRVSVLVFALVFCPFLTSTSAATQACCSSTRVVAGVQIDQQAGVLSKAEGALLRRLSEKMLPLPDTIRVRTDSVHFGTYSPIGGTVISLSRDRFHPPDSLSRAAPYLYGRVNATESRPSMPPPRYTHTLAHELAHFLSPHLVADEPRPAWGTVQSLSASRRVQEIEAEIIAAVLQEIAFGTEMSALGYPTTIIVPGLGPKQTRELIREYRGIIADTWRLPAVGT